MKEILKSLKHIPKKFSSLTSRGFSTLELMIALLIMTTTLTAVVLVTLGIPSAIAGGHEQEIGASEASALLQKEFLVGLTSFTSIVSIATSTSIISNTLYKSSLTVILQPDGLTKKLFSTTSWTNAHGLPEEITFSGLITDFSNAAQRSCSTILAGNWTHPSVSRITLASPAPIQALTTSSSTLIAAVTTTLGKTDPTLFFFNIALSTHPLFLSSLDNATSTRSGYAALVTNGDLLFGADSHAADFSTCTTGAGCNQLQILDITNPASPIVIENFTLATATAPFAVGSGGQSAGKSIFYAHGLIYLGLQKTGSSQGEEFNIINVQNPNSPQWLGGYSIGRTVNHIEVANGYAYLATDDPTAELTILDVHDPTHITLAGSYDEPGYTSFGYGEALSLASTSLILGRSYILNEPQFTIFNISSSSSPVVIGSEPITSTTTTTSIESVILRNYLALILTSTELEFWNITDLTQPVPYAAPVPLPGSGTGAAVSNASLTCQNNTLYLASTDSTNTGYLTAITGS